MKKKHLRSRLILGKKTIISLTESDTVTVKGGATIDCARTQDCTALPYCELTNRCQRTIQVNQTQCCATWPPLCDSILVSCIG